MRGKNGNGNFNRQQQQQVGGELIPISLSPSYLFDFVTQGHYSHFTHQAKLRFASFQRGGAVEKGRLHRIYFCFTFSKEETKAPLDGWNYGSATPGDVIIYDEWVLGHVVNLRAWEGKGYDGLREGPYYYWALAHEVAESLRILCQQVWSHLIHLQG